MLFFFVSVFFYLGTSFLTREYRILPCYCFFPKGYNTKTMFGECSASTQTYPSASFCRRLLELFAFHKIDVLSIKLASFTPKEKELLFNRL